MELNKLDILKKHSSEQEPRDDSRLNEGNYCENEFTSPACNKSTQTLHQGWTLNSEDSTSQKGHSISTEQNKNVYETKLSKSLPPTEAQMESRSVDSSRYQDQSTEDCSMVPLNCRRNRRRSKEVRILPEDFVSIQKRSEARQQSQQHIDIVTEEPRKASQLTKIFAKDVSNWPNLRSEHPFSRCSSIAEIHVVPDTNNSDEHSIPSNKIIFYGKHPCSEGECNQSRYLHLKRSFDSLSKDTIMDYNSILKQGNNQVIEGRITKDGENKHPLSGNIKLIFILILTIVSTATVTSFVWNFIFITH